MSDAHCQRADVAPLCAALEQGDEIEAFVYPDPSGPELDAGAIEASVDQVGEAFGPGRIIEASQATGRVFARLNTDTLRRAAAIPGARIAPNTFHAAPETAPAPNGALDSKKSD